MSEVAAAPQELTTQAALLVERNKALHARFDELYKKKRLRHDDVLNQLAKEFFITPRTIRGVLKAGLSEPAAPAAAAPTADTAPAAQD